MLIVKGWCSKIVIQWVNLKALEGVDWRFSPLPYIAYHIEELACLIYSYRFT